MAAAAVVETVALRARREPEPHPGRASPLRTPAEPSPALAGRGRLPPGECAGVRRGSVARGRGAHCQRGLWVPGPGPRTSPAGPARGWRCGAPSSAWGPRGGRRRRGRGAAAGPRDRFVYKHCRARGCSLREPGARDPRPGWETHGRGRASLRGQVWGGGAELGSPLPPPRRPRSSDSVGSGWGWGRPPSTRDAASPSESPGDTWTQGAALGASHCGTGRRRNFSERVVGPGPNRDNRSQVPAWPRPGFSPVSLPRGWARSPAQRNAGASAASASPELALRGGPDLSPLPVHRAWPPTSSGVFPSVVGFPPVLGACGVGGHLFFWTSCPEDCYLCARV